MAGGERPEAGGRRSQAFSLVSLLACWINKQTIQRSITVLGGALNSAQSNQSFVVESIVMTKLQFRVNAWLIMRNPLNCLYKHTMRLALSFDHLSAYRKWRGSTLIICRRGWSRIKTKLQISACCELWCSTIARTCTLAHNWRKVGPVPAFRSIQRQGGHQAGLCHAF